MNSLPSQILIVAQNFRFTFLSTNKFGRLIVKQRIEVYMPHGYKKRNWMAYLAVSASGPEFSPKHEEDGRIFRPRVTADLKYTTADVDYLEPHFKEPNEDSAETELHKRLKSPTVGQFYDVLQEIQTWLRSFKDDPNWDGGGIQLCYAGHGRINDGAFVLDDGFVEPGVFMDALRIIANEVSKPGRLRISIILDSCYSGAFITEILEECFKGNLVVPFHLFASCMVDEVAWEESSLGHGIFTYSFSVRSESPSSLAAVAIQPDNSYGPSLSIGGGKLGCSLLTVGAQNPISYCNGCGEIEVGTESLNIFDDDSNLRSLEDIRSWLKVERDKIVEVIKPMRPNWRIERNKL